MNIFCPRLLPLAKRYGLDEPVPDEVRAAANTRRWPKQPDSRRSTDSRRHTLARHRDAVDALGRGDEFHYGSPGLDPRSLPNGPKPRDIEDAYRHLDQIRVKTRDFR